MLFVWLKFNKYLYICFRLEVRIIQFPHIRIRYHHINLRIWYLDINLRIRYHHINQITRYKAIHLRIQYPATMARIWYQDINLDPAVTVLEDIGILQVPQNCIIILSTLLSFSFLSPFSFSFGGDKKRKE